ncbi:hypothetical protein STEG23_007345 [Scotinomys teguina]
MAISLPLAVGQTDSRWQVHQALKGTQIPVCLSLCYYLVVVVIIIIVIIIIIVVVIIIIIIIIIIININIIVRDLN